jgi:signal transduction histidine kinase/predicted RNA-binding protein with RPS1 domain
MGNVSPATRPLPRIAMVKVKVVEAKPSGIRVALEDGRKGFIRPREISWERRISRPPELPKCGETLDVVILEESRGDLLFLSQRQCTDPWSEAKIKGKYKSGQIVEGEVVNTRNTGIYVQLEPGVDAIIVPRYIPRLREQSSEDILWLGDKISAKIIAIKHEKRLIELNLIKRLQELPTEKENQEKQQLTYFGATEHPRILTADTGKQPVHDHEKRQFIRPSVGKLQRILVVDNEEEWLNLLGQGLKKEYKEYGVKVDTAFNEKQALEKIGENNIYDIIIIDLYLDNGEIGTVVAEKVRKINKDTPIILVSLADFAEYGDTIQKYDYPICYKSLRDVVEKIENLRRGYLSTPLAGLIGKDDSFIRQLGMQVLSNQSPVELYTEILDWLWGQTDVSHCLFVELDRSQHTGKIIASKPSILEDELQIAQDGLYYSPARQVVEEDREFCEIAIDFEKESRFDNFFKNIYYESCFGLPIRIPDRPNRYALFLLDEDPLGFLEKEDDGDQRILYARVASYFFTVAIERIALLDYMRKYEIRYTLGQLLADMLHETNNKLATIDAGFLNIKNHWGNRPLLSETEQMQTWLDKSDEMIQQVNQYQSELHELVKSYSRQANNDYEPVDINHIVNELNRQLKRDAKQAGINIVLDLGKNLPPARAIRSQLQQVILNLALNSIQMISHQRDIIKVFGEQSGEYIPALQTGIIIIQTRCGGERSVYPIEIRVIDNGPGIHWRDQERVFAPGFTRRSGGAGLGLYISRNLIERMGGRLNLFDSIMFVGSTFLLELQSYSDV